MLKHNVDFGSSYVTETMYRDQKQMSVEIPATVSS
jgi:hypothetical protein